MNGEENKSFYKYNIDLITAIFKSFFKESDGCLNTGS